MDTALPEKFPFILDRNLAKANCTENRVCTSCDTVVFLQSINGSYLRKIASGTLFANFFLIPAAIKEFYGNKKSSDAVRGELAVSWLKIFMVTLHFMGSVSVGELIMVLCL